MTDIQYDATGRMIRTWDKEEDQNEGFLPPPTRKPVNKGRMEKLLEYDPNKGGGDFHSLLRYGPEPRWIALDAEKEANKRFPNAKGFADESDAFRHALGSYMMTKKYGAIDSKKILDRHERSPGSGISREDNDETRLQDLYNNRIGRDAALDIKNKDRDPVEVVKELYRGGKLQTRPFVLERESLR